MTESQRSRYNEWRAHDELVAALTAALPLLEKLALEEKRGNLRRKAMGDPLWTTANKVWDNARAVLAAVSKEAA